MIITATSQPLRVDFRIEGKSYNESSELGQFDQNDRTTWPFESKEVAPGEAFPVPGNADVLRVVRMGGNPQPTEQPEGA